MFPPIQPPESTVDVVTRVISHSIFAGELSVGDRLPPERQLAAELSVNRVTVRSALDRLTTAGLVSRRQGSGYRVLDFRRTGGPSLLEGVANVARQRGELAPVVEDLLSMRRSLARSLMETLAARLDERGLALIRGAVDDFADAVERGAPVRSLLHADMEVLMALLIASSSRVLPLCFNPVREALQGLPELVEAMYATPHENVAAFRLLVELLTTAPTDLVGHVDALLASRDRKTLQRFVQESPPS